MDKSIEINGVAYQLPDIEADAWTRLLNASLRAKDAFRTAALATQSRATQPGTETAQRTVVLRQTDRQTQAVFFHSDRRADKTGQIEAQPRVSCLFYDDRSRIQLRLQGTATVFMNDATADEHWNKLPVSSRKSYFSLLTPGSVQAEPTDGLPENLQNRVLPTPAQSEAGRANFAVIRVQITFMDWLWLGENGHRRAQFAYENGALARLDWVAP